MQTSTSVAMLLLLLTAVTTLEPHLVSAAVTDPSAAQWDPVYGPQRASRGFRFGGADRFSHGFGRRRRVDDMKVTSPLS